MIPDDIVLVNYHTSEYEGSVKPSSEKELHCEIYRTRKEVQAVIHTHQINASVVAAARREVPPILDEAFVACQVLEKACKAFIEAEFLGGAKGINKFEARLMHQLYLKKYSAEAKKNR